MKDIVDEINAVHRETGRRGIPAGEARTVLLRRTYDAPAEDVWDALTDPARISRWFLPITGDLRLGGKYQLEGNAGGEILQCEPPRLLKASWVYGEEPAEPGGSVVEVRLSPGPGGETVFELEHTAIVDPEWWAKYGPGAVGVGWDLALLGLGLHLRGESIGDPSAWERSPEARRLMTASSGAWGAAMAAAGATGDEIATAVANTTEFYVPDAGSAEGRDTTG
ncbi:SRPBCC family protein [Sphaerisporangium flaviroseum]|uniref:SRPBCC family protein n=1 Tax=Sphaerisporangium flaviroseum TaxID=509199 RepID=A0ABP7HPK7_9ACTN